MNRSNFVHAWFALLMQVVTWAVLAFLIEPLIAVWVAALLPTGIFLGIEYNQHTYRFGGPKVAPWWRGLVSGWNRDSIFDFVAPVAACLLLASLATLITVL